MVRNTPEKIERKNNGINRTKAFRVCTYYYGGEHIKTDIITESPAEARDAFYRLRKSEGYARMFHAKMDKDGNIISPWKFMYGEDLF
jgi:hypothetical protein